MRKISALFIIVSSIFFAGCSPEKSAAKSSDENKAPENPLGLELGGIYTRTFTVNDETVTRKVQLTEMTLFDKEKNSWTHTNFFHPEENYVESITENGYETIIGSGDNVKKIGCKTEIVGDEKIITEYGWQTRITVRDAKTGIKKSYRRIESDYEFFEKYDETGEKVIYSEYIGKECTTTTEYEYNKEGKEIRCVEKKVFKSEENGENKPQIKERRKEYNDRGQMIHSVTKSLEDGLTYEENAYTDEEKYDDEGRLIYEFHSEGDTISETNGSWDSETRTMHWSSTYWHEWDYGDVEPFRWYTHYDEQGREINGIDHKGEKFEYKYDDKGQRIYECYEGDVEDRILTRDYDENENVIHYLWLPTQIKIRKYGAKKSDYSEEWSERFPGGNMKWSQSTNGDVLIDEDAMIGGHQRLIYRKFRNKEVFWEYVLDDEGNSLTEYGFTSVDGVWRYKKEHTPSYDDKTFCVEKATNLYESPSAESKILEEMNLGTKVEALEYGENEKVEGSTISWIKVRTEGSEGWCADRNLGVDFRLHEILGKWENENYLISFEPSGDFYLWRKENGAALETCDFSGKWELSHCWLTIADLKFAENLPDPNSYRERNSYNLTIEDFGDGALKVKTGEDEKEIYEFGKVK